MKITDAVLNGEFENSKSLGANYDSFFSCMSFKGLEHQVDLKNIININDYTLSVNG